MSKILDEAFKLRAVERVEIAERLFESVETEADDDQDEDEIQRAWTQELQRRPRELCDGTVKGLRAAIEAQAVRVWCAARNRAVGLRFRSARTSRHSSSRLTSANRTETAVTCWFLQAVKGITMDVPRAGRTQGRGASCSCCT